MARLAPGVCLSTLLGLSACVALYHDDVGLPGVVRVTAIDPTTILISARSDGTDDIASINDYALLKAADETLQRGYDHFKIVDSQQVTRAEQEALSDPDDDLRGSMTQSTRFESALSEGEDILVSLVKGAGYPGPTANLYSAFDVEANLGPRVRGDAQAPIMARLVPPKLPTEVETNPTPRVQGDAQRPIITSRVAAPPESGVEVDANSGLRIRSDARLPTIASIASPDPAMDVDPNLGIRIRSEPPPARVTRSSVARVLAALRAGSKLRLGLPRNEDKLGPFARSCNRRELALAAAAQLDGLRYELECR